MTSLREAEGDSIPPTPAGQAKEENSQGGLADHVFARSCSKPTEGQRQPTTENYRQQVHNTTGTVNWEVSSGESTPQLDASHHQPADAWEETTAAGALDVERSNKQLSSSVVPKPLPMTNEMMMPPGRKKKRRVAFQTNKRSSGSSLRPDIYFEIQETSSTESIPPMPWASKKKRSTRRTKLGSQRLDAIHQFLSQASLQERRNVSHWPETCQGEMNNSNTQEDLAENIKHSSKQQTRKAASVDDDSDSDYEIEKEVVQKKRTSVLPVGDKAISKSGYTCRGRVKQKAQKRVELVRVGSLRLAKGWYNAGYIFPLGYKSKTMFRSSVDLDAMCVHECEIVEGIYWPAPTFVITAKDRSKEALSAKSCTGCWSLILQRINREIVRRRQSGESLPPPPKTAIAGPEYFGLNQDDILRRIESLDPEKKCELYWAGKIQLKLAIHSADQKGRSTVDASKSSRYRTYISDSEEEDQNGDEEGIEHASNVWSTIGRLDRYKRRCRERGGESEAEEDDNPLPELIDPITMQQVVTPAISPYGHVVGLATWKACLSDQRVCPFTRNPLTVEHCTVLTKSNIEKYRDKIIQR